MRALTSLALAAACLLLPLGGGALPRALADTGSELLDQLRSAIERGDVEARRTAFVDVGRLGSRLSANQARSAAVALRKNFATEEVSELRRLMIRALARLKSTHAWIQVIWTSQADRDPEVQQAARSEILNGRADFLEMLGRLLAEEKSESFRAELLLLCRDRRRTDAVPLLLDALEGRSLMLRAAAAESLEAISTKALGYDVAAWRAWWEEEGRKAAAKSGPSVAPEGPVEEPPPHVTQRLIPHFFRLPLTAKDIVFVVDVSGSVGSGGVDRARQQLADAVDLLGSDVRVAAIFFSETAQYWNDGALMPATPRNKEDLRRFLRSVKPGKRTDVFTPLHAGLALLDRRVREKEEAKEPFLTPVAMVVVSDGQDNVGATPPRIVADKLERLDPLRTVVHAVVLGPKDSALMFQVARMGSGHYLRTN